MPACSSFAIRAVYIGYKLLEPKRKFKNTKGYGRPFVWNYNWDVTKVTYGGGTIVRLKHVYAAYIVWKEAISFISGDFDFIILVYNLY